MTTTTQDILKTTERFDNILAKKQIVQAQPVDTSNNSQIAYQSLTVIKKLSKAKFPVYLTTSKVNKQNYAMKIFAYKGEEPHPYYKNESRFSVLKHPHVIETVYKEDSKDTLYKGELKKVSYTLMEYAPYGDFFDLITKHRDSFDEKLVRTYFRQLVEGIEYLHACNVAHLDLKPENLLVAADFNLRIADFDLSHVIGDKKIFSRGTRYYRGPEFFKAENEPKLTKPFASDVYSAGIILFILKSGGVYAHSENSTLEGIDLVDLMHNKNNDFWIKHCEIQEKSSSFYDKNFRELFNAMTKYNPEERISFKEVKASKWYQGSVYSTADLQKKMKKILKV